MCARPQPLPGHVDGVVDSVAKFREPRMTRLWILSLDTPQKGARAFGRRRRGSSFTGRRMETSLFAKRFGGVELARTLSALARSKHACARLKKALGPERGDAAVEALRSASLDGVLGAEIHDFLVDEIENEARIVWSGLIVDPEDEDNPDRRFPVDIFEYEGIYLVWALEHDPAGYFLAPQRQRFVAAQGSVASTARCAPR